MRRKRRRRGILEWRDFRGRLFLVFLFLLLAAALWLNGDVVYGVVTHVVDGDTVHVKTKGETRTVRLVGVDTPETVHPKKPVQFYGREASAFTKDSLTNEPVWLEYDVSPLDRYKRHLAYVWLERPPGAQTLRIDEAAIRRGMFNARLLLEGYGRVMTIQPNSRYADLFVKFEREARENNRGLWGEGKKSK